MMLKVALSTTL